MVGALRAQGLGIVSEVSVLGGLVVATGGKADLRSFVEAIGEREARREVDRIEGVAILAAHPESHYQIVADEVVAFYKKPRISLR